MIENLLLSYGPLGAWTIWLLYEKQKMLSGLRTTMQKNTEVLQQISTQLKGGYKK